MQARGGRQRVHKREGEKAKEERDIAYFMQGTAAITIAFIIPLSVQGAHSDLHGTYLAFTLTTTTLVGRLCWGRMSGSWRSGDLNLGILVSSPTL